MRFNMKFDFIIGNPPYQETRNNTSDVPVYPYLMNEAYRLSDKVLLITPARFLKDVGKTSKQWNEKMLSDDHFKVLEEHLNSQQIFPNTNIKGGVVITYRDARRIFGAIGCFISQSELLSLFRKVQISFGISLAEIMFSDSSYKLSDIIHLEQPVACSRLKDSAKRFFATNVFNVLGSDVFSEMKVDDDYVGLYGLVSGHRVVRYLKSSYVVDPGNLYKYKVFVPKSNGSGALGEVLSTPVIGQPVIGQPAIGHTQTFISIGSFDTEEEAEACLKYIKSKFARVMLGICKVTQHNSPKVWQYVPLQDFTVNSDIDWSVSISEIDRQLYEKYGLDVSEIDFIETHVTAMD